MLKFFQDLSLDMYWGRGSWLAEERNQAFFSGIAEFKKNWTALRILLLDTGIGYFLVRKNGIHKINGWNFQNLIKNRQNFRNFPENNALKEIFGKSRKI